MAFVLIAVMVAILIGAVVMSKGRSFFKYAEMSRTLQSVDESGLSKRLPQRRAVH